MSYSHKLTILLSALLLCTFVQGCNEDPAEFEKIILAHDPTFEDKLEIRDSLRDKMNSAKTEFLNNKQQLDTAISSLKDKKTKLSRGYSIQIEKIKDQVYPARQQLKEELVNLKARYALEGRKLKETEHDMDEVTQLINKKDDLSLTHEEVKTWNDRLTSLIKEKEDLISGIEKLKKDISIAVMKIKVFKI